MTRVLWVTPHADPEMRSGGALRTGHLLRSLTDAFEVHLFVVGGRPADSDRLVASTGVASARWLPGAEGLRARRLCVRHGWPLAVARAWNPDLADRLSLAGDDVLVAEHFQTAVYRPAGPYVLHLQNVDGVRVAELPYTGSAQRRLEMLWEKRVLPQWERRATRHPSARVITVSEHDAEVLGVRATVIPNGTQLRPPREAPRQGLLLFVGALDYPPNASGLRWWTEHVHPHLPAGVPRLTVVGRGGRAALGALADHPGLDVVGEVPDLAPLYEQAALAVVPLLHGSGTRLKVLEAMAWSVPVVSTTKGAEGLPLVHGRDLAVADAPEELAGLVGSLLGSPEAAALGRAGRQAAEAFSWDLRGQELRELVSAVARERGGPTA